MQYSLPTLAVNEIEFQSIQSCVLQVMLQCMHVSSTIPTSIWHGTIKLGGLGLYDLRTEAGVEALKFFRNSIYSQSENGKLLQMNLQYSQLESSIGYPLLKYPSIHVAYLTPLWVLSLRQYMSCLNISIKLTEEYTLRLTVPNVQYIMQQRHFSRYTTSQYLQVLRLSEMVDRTKPYAIQLAYLR
jgi:hypothetical protein